MALARSISGLPPVIDVDGVRFNTAAVLAHVEGQAHWDNDDKTLELDTEIAGVHIQVGQELVVRCTNKTLDDFTKGTVVIVNGAQGFRPTIVKAQANSEPLSDGTLGLTEHAIGKNDTGYVITEGLLRDIDTGSFAEGNKLYLSPTVAGGYTVSEPVAPYHVTQLGYVLKAHSTEGIIYVRVQSGYEIGEMHDVHVSSVVDNHLLKYVAANSRWENSDTFAVAAFTITGLTQGSVLFAGAGGAVSQDNAQFFYDNANDRLGIGTANPRARVEVYNAASDTGVLIGTGAVSPMYLYQTFSTLALRIGYGDPSVAVTGLLDMAPGRYVFGNYSIVFASTVISTSAVVGELRANTGTDAGWSVHNESAVGSTSMRLWKPGITAISGGQLRMVIPGSASVGTLFGQNIVGLGLFDAAIIPLAIGTSNAQPFTLGANTAENIRMPGDSNQNVLFGGQATYGTNATRTLALATGTAPTSSPADAVQFYSKDFAAGNACPYFRTEGGTEIGLNQSLLTTDSPTLAALTLSGLTLGSVPFAGAGGLISQDNAKLFWDNTNKRLGIGTAAPSQFLDVVGGNIQHKGQGHLFYQDIDTVGLAAANDYAGIRFTRGGVTTFMGGLQFDGNTFSGGPNLQNGVVLFNFLANGFLDFHVGAGVNDITRKARITVGGNLLLGGLVAAGTSAVSVLAIKSGTAPTASIVDGVQFYSMDRAAGQAGLAIRNEGNVHHMIADRVGFGFASYADLTGLHTILQVNGGVAEALVTKTATYTMTINDRTVRADASAGIMSIVIMSPSDITGRTYAVTKVDGTANQVRVQFVSATCNGASEFVIATQYAGAIFIADGTSNTWAVF